MHNMSVHNNQMMYIRKRTTELNDLICLEIKSLCFKLSLYITLHDMNCNINV